MSRCTPASRTWLAALALVTFSARARAQEAPEAIRLVYSAPVECPDALTFTARVRERTARGRFAEAGELARTFSVTVSADASGYAGSIEFLSDGASTVSRRVHGEQCDAVVSSLALITALSLDSALQNDERELVAEPTPPPPRPLEPPRRPAPPRARSTSVAVSRSGLEAARIGISGGYGSALPAPRFDLLAQLDWRSRVALRLSAHYGWHELGLDPDRSAKLRQQGLELSLCPRRFRWGPWVVAPCAAFDFGSLRAAGVPSRGLSSVRAQTIWWASLGAQVAVAFEPHVPFWVELRAGGELPLRAGYQFIFDAPRAVAYEVPHFAGSLALASGVRFW